ncbi:MAG: hypothetical protein O2779_00040 [Nanoarchaeota archaeon]|nr:hypothetical protein [Nanoarchaeota archaeon]
MNIRNVQKTGNMHYVYLPTSWCKQYNISSSSKVSVTANNDGSLTVSPDTREAEQHHLTLDVPEASSSMLIKLIMACYVNPTQSFTLKLAKQTNLAALLDKRRSISALEFVELEGDTITHESSISIKDPKTILKMMVKKIHSLSHVMLENYDRNLINRYEEEIDKSKLLITKSVVSSLADNAVMVIKPLDLHYIALLASHLERMVDSLIMVDSKETAFLKQVSALLGSLKELTDRLSSLDLTRVIDFEAEVSALKTPDVNNIKTYGMRRIRINLNKVTEVLFDWVISNKIIKK